ncbi:zinc finger protein ZFP2-like [Sabethes cyaneus]|uniref:zinc finger protein ZFP2-like n=1 Tax=Sabethes cyaneus TaxID=53552 RepID=UPI00237ECB73|nr:zinc finger protein ZFP2-like [Sabethes cyaneus]
MNFVNCCRLCLMDLVTDNDDGGTDCYRVSETTIDAQPLSVALEECFGISIADDEKVNKICETCYNDVHNVVKLRNRFLEADAAIKSFYCQLDYNLDVEYLEGTAETDDDDGRSSIIVEEAFPYENEQSNVKHNSSDDDEDIKDEPVDTIVEVNVDETAIEEIKYEMDPDVSVVEEDEKLAEVLRNVPKARRKGWRKGCKSKEKKVKFFTCYICTTDFETLEQLDDHIPLHVGTVSPVCTFCSEEVTTMRHLNMHLQRVHYRKGNRIPCEECEKEGITKEFSSTYHLQEHVKRVHQGIKEVLERKFVCSYCGKNFNRASNLRLHENIHTKAVLFKCKYCTTFVGTSRSGLIRHERIHTAEKPFKCDECDAAFTQSNGLQLHKKFRHTDERPFACDLCQGDVRFKSKYTLQKHLRSHEIPGRIKQDGVKSESVGTFVEPELKCSFCPGVYHQERHLCRHILLKHPNENFPMVQCEMCAEMGKETFFVTENEKTIHLRNHVKNPPRKIIRKERRCRTCSAVFFTIEALTRHRQTHVVHECKECGKTYKRRAGMRLHYLSVHHASRPYKCDKCDVSYGQFTQLTAHLKTHQ